MRTAIWSAFLAVIPMACSGMWIPQQSAESAEQQALPKKQPPPPPAGEPAAKSTAAPEIDPIKTAPSAVLPMGLPVDGVTFVIGSDDQLAIRVWGDDRLSSAVLVRPDGRISMNLIGEVMASGRTPEQLSRDIEALLREKEILRKPQVNVQVTSVQSKKYSINGEVNRPGAFPLTVPTRIMEALVNAGGFRDFANKKSIQIIRGDKRLKFNWNEVIKGKKTEQNVFLEPGDIIIVK